MNRKSIVYFVLAVFVLAAVSGCSTVPKKTKEEISGIKTRVETLETKVDSIEAKQAEMAARPAAPSVIEESQETSAKESKSNISVKPRYVKGRKHTREVQTALKNAGFYKGRVDGVNGKKTRRAVKEFQKANGLNADGVAGPKTWELLSKYAEGQTAGAAATEGAEK